MRSKLIVLGLVAALLVSVVAPSFVGRAQAAVPAASVAHVVQPHPVATGRIAFAIHAGIAFFAFHHVYKLYKRGDYNKGAHFRTLHLIAAVGYLVLAFHEVTKAYDSAKNSSSKTLRLLVAPLSGMAAVLSRLSSGIRTGNFSPNDFESVNTGAAQFSARSKAAGYPVTESSSGM